MPDSRLDAEHLEQLLRREVDAEVHADAYTLGRYSTDASIYQVRPRAVVLPRTVDAVRQTIQLAAEHGLPVTPRGAGTSQSGQAIGPGLVIDDSRYLDRILDLDVPGQRCTVQPGIVLDSLNRQLAPHGLMFPIDVATANRATLGGMAGNNSAGARSIRYGLMVDHVREIEAVLPDGASLTFGPDQTPDPRASALLAAVTELHARERDELDARIPKVLRHVAGYNLHRMGGSPPNLAELLVGSEGTLGMFTKLELGLSPIPSHRVLGVTHFPTLRAAMSAVQDLVTLEPSAVELVDRTLIELARENPEFRAAIGEFVRGEPGALLLVEFAGADRGKLEIAIDRLRELLGELGYPDAVVPALTESQQQRIWSVRRAGLNIVMSMKGEAKPVSFIEDCAVPLDRLAEYSDRLTEVFARHGTSGTWYAHASVGCLHVRPALNLKNARGARAMREIALEAHEIVREFKGSHSGEHGDGMVRSEFLEPMLGQRLVRAFEEIKALFDAGGIMNPGKIVSPPRMDDRTLFRYPPSYQARPVTTSLDWNDWSGLLGAVEMCNNNGACRKLHDGVMCPSYRATRDEQHTTRGRANTLRLALTGQLGEHALTSSEMYETMDLCVGCKACRRECPTGVDMARMKLEFLAGYRAEHGVPRRDRLIAHLPRMAPRLSRVSRLANLRNRIPLVRQVTARVTGLSARRAWPEWSPRRFDRTDSAGPRDGREVVLLVDTFNRYFEPENAEAAAALLTAAGYRVQFPGAPGESRPLCCGRTYLSAGMVDEARVEARRTVGALLAYAERGIPIVGLEPSCLLTLRDEFTALGVDNAKLVASRARLFSEWFVEREPGGPDLDLPPLPLSSPIIVHGHCHQKAFGAFDAAVELLRSIPGADVRPIDASCCGMAGSFGYEAEHDQISVAMAELDLAPAVRRADPGAVIVADGFSCRHQIHHTTGRRAVHSVRLLRPPPR